MNPRQAVYIQAINSIQRDVKSLRMDLQVLSDANV